MRTEDRFVSDLLRVARQGEPFTVLSLAAIAGTSFAQFSEDTSVVALWLAAESRKNGHGLVERHGGSSFLRVYLLSSQACAQQKEKRRRERHGPGEYTKQMHPENRILALYRELDGRNFSYTRPSTLGGYANPGSFKYFLRSHEKRGLYFVEKTGQTRRVIWTPNGHARLGQCTEWLHRCRYYESELLERLYSATRGSRFLPGDEAAGLRVHPRSLRQRLEKLVENGWLRLGEKEPAGRGTPRAKQYYREWTEKAHTHYGPMLGRGG